jgi:arylsulfatase A-like enzyme
MRLHRPLHLLAGVAFCCGTATASAVQDRPNLVFILADDLGYGELGCFGQEVIRTPRLDRMAEEGMRFTQFYAGATVCAPSRSVLMTGRHQGRTSVRGNSIDPTKFALTARDHTVARALQEGGYRTALFGKWGLGEFGAAAAGLPERQGFDAFFGYLNHHHAHNHFPDHLWRGNERIALPNRARAVGDFGGSVTEDAVLFADDLLVDEVLKWIGNNQAVPFLLHWHPVIPHANNERTRELGDGAHVPDYGPYALEDWPDQDKGHAAMITRLDTYVGRLLDHLRLLGIAEKTIVVFTSDNGPHDESRHDLARFRPAGPFTGKKRNLTEGGIRVPTIAWGPGRIPAGATSEHVAYFGDWYATAAQLAGLPVPEGLDSISFAPTLLARDGQARHEFLYWEFNESGFRQAALWRGRWKAHRTTEPEVTFSLFDLYADPAERKDVSAHHEDLVARFETFFETARTEAPNWPARARAE